MRGAGCGVREGVGADAPEFYMGDVDRRGRNGIRTWDLGFREGVPLTRHEIYMGMYTGWYLYSVIIKRIESSAIVGLGNLIAECGKALPLMRQELYMGNVHRRS